MQWESDEEASRLDMKWDSENAQTTISRKRDKVAKKTVVEIRRVVKVGRNKPCPCGSGKKYKKCCISAYEPPEGI